MKNIIHFEKYAYEDIPTDFQLSSRPQKTYSGSFKKWAQFESDRMGIEKILREILSVSLGEEFSDWVLIYLYSNNAFSVIIPPVETLEENQILQKKIVRILSESSGSRKISEGPVTHEGFRIGFF
jgi:hypothetical protein